MTLNYTLLNKLQASFCAVHRMFLYKLRQIGKKFSSQSSIYYVLRIIRNETKRVYLTHPLSIL